MSAPDLADLVARVEGWETLEPDLGASEPEPPLREVIYGYYSKHFDADRASALTSKYIEAITAALADREAPAAMVEEAVLAERERCLAGVRRLEACEVQFKDRQRFSVTDMNRQHRRTCAAIADEINGEAVWGPIDQDAPK